MIDAVTVRADKLGSLSLATLARLRELTVTGASEFKFLLDRGRADDEVWIAERASEVVGWCVIYRPFRGFDVFRKIGVYVAPECRDQGIGSKLVLHTLAAVSASPLPVHAVPTTEEGRAFFRRFPHLRVGQPRY